MRKCTKCGILYWPPERYFSADRSRKDGLYPHCKVCTARYQHQNRESITEIKRQWRQENLERLRPLRRARTKAWREENREEWLAYRREYHEANKERENERSLAWKRNNPEWVSAYEKSPQGKAVRAVQNARRRNDRALADLTAWEWRRILENQNHECGACGCSFSDKVRPERDHIKPLVLGGALTKTNVQALCRSCNARKGARYDGR